MSHGADLTSIRRAARRAELRMRIGRMVALAPTVLTIALGFVGVAVALRKIAPDHVPESWALAAIASAVLGVVGALSFAALRRLPPHAGALALDHHYGTHGRLTNALEFAAIEREKRTGFMDAAIEDALESAPRLAARQAVRIPFPPEIGISVAVGVGVIALALLEVQTLRAIPPPPAQANIDALEIPDDDLELFKDALEAIARDQQSPEVQAAIERFNQLLEDIAARRLNREEAFRRMQQLEDEMLAGAEADKKALEDALEQTAKELEKSDLSKPTAEALKKKDLEQAKKELQKLAQTLKSDKKPSKQELERLRQALERAAENKKKALEALNEQRAAMRQDLLEKKKELEKNPPKDQKERDREEQLLKKKKRELERLDREAKKQQDAMRRLDRLDRDLAKAAQDLLRDLGLSGEDLERAAEDLNRMQQDAMSDEEKEELRKRLQELRELIRQQGQGGQKMRERLQRFLRKAGGQQGQGQQGQGQQGQGQQGQRKPGQGQPGQGQPGQQPGDGPGQGDLMRDQPGQGEGDQPGGMMIGPGGQPIPVPGGGQGSGEGSGDQPGEGSGEGGESYGTGKGGEVAGDKTNLDAKTHDVRADAVDSGGPTNAEVILSAADRGFRGKPYQKVYKEYRTHAEDQIETEKIPDGMRFYVRRYFQLIRPRD